MNKEKIIVSSEYEIKPMPSEENYSREVWNTMQMIVKHLATMNGTIAKQQEDIDKHKEYFQIGKVWIGVLSAFYVVLATIIGWFQFFSKQ